MEWTIRQAIPEDAAALAACIDAAYGVYADRISDLPHVSGGIEDDIAQHLVFVAMHGQSIGGGMILVPRDRFVHLANIAVAPEYAGHGLGRTLLERAEVEARQLGKRELRLSTHVKMPDNVALYSHLGWEELERTGNKVHMRKTL